MSLNLKTNSDQALVMEAGIYGDGEISSQVCDCNAPVQLVDSFAKAYFSWFTR